MKMKSKMFFSVAFLMFEAAGNVCAAAIQPPARPPVTTGVEPGEGRREREHTIHGHHNRKVKKTAAVEKQEVIIGKVEVAKIDNQEKGK